MLVVDQNDPVASGSSGGSVPQSGWAGARRPSEHKRPETYPPDNEAVPVERRWPRQST